MKQLEGITTDKVELEVVECDCGFHLGLDATYLEQVGDFVITCPSCKTEIDTKVIIA